MHTPERLGKYRITEVLGVGAMGVVYKGFDPDIKRTVAIKTIRRSFGLADEGAALAGRFRNEAVAAGRLTHPGIVAVYDFGEHDDVAYIAMEFVEGQTLAHHLAHRTRFKDEDIPGLICQVLDALEHAHDAGVWHRDIKPANIIMAPNGRLKVADFGIARIEDAGLTQSTAVIGTPTYMAPEQFLGVKVDKRVDLYACGVLLYILLTGKPPFFGPTQQLMYKVVNEPPVMPSQVPGAQRPHFYDVIIARALAKDPDQRFPDAASFRNAVLRGVGKPLPAPAWQRDVAAAARRERAAPRKPAPEVHGNGAPPSPSPSTSLADGGAAAALPDDPGVKTRVLPRALASEADVPIPAPGASRQRVLNAVDAVKRIRALLEAGTPWDACDTFRQTVADAPNDADLLYWGALAYARAGAGHDALDLLERAQAHVATALVQVDEVLSLRGRIWKDRLLQTSDPAERERFAGRAREHYLAGYAVRRGNPYPGINAATLSLVVGDRLTAITLAREVLSLVEARAQSPGDWDDATAAEAHLLLGQPEQALLRYRSAVAAAGAQAGRIASMRRQIQLLMQVLPEAGAMLEVLRVPAVLAFVGHLMDAPGRTPPRFPPAAVPAVAAAIRLELERIGPAIVYTSAASGADLLCIEAALEAGAEVNVILPFDRQDFVKTSVAPAGVEWVERFERLLPRTSQVIVAIDEHHLGDDELFDHAARLVEGLAVLRASQLQVKPAMLCLLDEQAKGGPGGARASAERWARHAGPPTVLDLHALRQGLPDDDPPAAPTPVTTDPAASDAAASDAAVGALSASRPRRLLRTLLFADVAGLGRPHDARAPLFHRRFLEIVADELRARAAQPAEVATWGDALMLAFERAADAARFALELRRRVAAEAWTSAGQRPSHALRVALHAGPVFCGFDPLRERDACHGSSVTRAARIEPLTPPGLIYVSEAFAATLAVEGGKGYACEYVGKMELVKGSGESRIYRLEDLERQPADPAPAARPLSANAAP